MNVSKDKIKVVVKSRKVLTDIVYGPVPQYPTYIGQGHRVPPLNRSRLYYSYILDGEQEAILGEAKAIAQQLGIGLEVTDLERQNILRRILRLMTGRAREFPSVLLPGEAIYALPPLTTLNASLDCC